MDQKKLNEVLKAYKIKATAGNITTNQFYAMYEIKPVLGFELKTLKNKIDTMQLFFDNPIILDVNNNKIYIKEISNNRQYINYFDVFNNTLLCGELPLLFGIGEDGKILQFDLAKAPHLLVAGTTGSGKSVFLHNLILSTLRLNNATLAMIDVKKVELSIYDNLPQLENHKKVVTSASEALNFLKSICSYMDSVYTDMQRLKVRTFQEYRQKTNAKYMIVIIDELADLLTSKIYKKDIELYTTRIAQLGRASGIHLIACTQRPDSNVITGTLKANIPSRVAFSVKSKIDSRIILDEAGAENLIGKGDGIFIPIGSNAIHFQSFNNNTDQIIDYISRYKKTSKRFKLF